MRFSIFTLFCTVIIFLSTGCNDEHSTVASTAETTKKSEIKTLVPEFGTYSIQASMAASVQPAPDGIISISAPVSGVISNIDVHIGDKITPTSPLITIRSSDISDTQNSQLAAKAAFTQTKHTYEMNKELFNLGAITENDLLLSHSNFQQAEAAMKGYSQKLAYFGASSNQTLVLHASISGVVYEIGTHLGDHITNDTTQPLIKIVDIHKKIVVATVYEKDISAFNVGKEVNIDLDNEQHLQIQGKVMYISDVQDPENKTTKVYIQPAIDSSELRINMFANVLSSVDIKDVYRIPNKSIIYKNGKFIVFVKNGDQFSPLDITIVSDHSTDNFSLVRGLTANTQIALEPIALERE